MKETYLYLKASIIALWNAPMEQFVWMINALVPQILLLLALWLTLRWLWRKAYPKQAKK